MIWTPRGKLLMGGEIDNNMGEAWNMVQECYTQIIKYVFITQNHCFYVG